MAIRQESIRRSVEAGNVRPFGGVFVVYWIDKERALRGRWRIREATLLGIEEIANLVKTRI
jgi:hypothetical protein